jgi:hypothetical protein
LADTFTETDALNGLTLHASHGGHHHDEATLTVTASNTTEGEAASSAAQTLKIKEQRRRGSRPSPCGFAGNGLFSKDAPLEDRAMLSSLVTPCCCY